MNKIDIMYQTMLAELGQRTFDSAFVSDFPSAGRFVAVTVKDRKYWYFDEPDGKGGQTRRYVGPVEDEEITARVENHKEVKSSLRACRRMVSSLTRDGGMIAPAKFSGDIVQALGSAGLFRLRGVLIGTVAFGCYSGVLGVRLPAAAIMTGDADIAQDYAISSEVGDSLPSITELLQKVDPTFRPVPHRSGGMASSAFVNSSGYRVEFLTTNRGSDDYLDHPAKMPALGGATADPIRFMDFLIRDPVRTVLLHNNGVSVVVPDPARYAVHKLIVASRRLNDDNGRAKQSKDILQAEILFEALGLTRREGDVALAWEEAYSRGEHWKAAIDAGVRLMSKKGRKIAAEVLMEGKDEIEGGGENAPDILDALR